MAWTTREKYRTRFLFRQVLWGKKAKSYYRHNRISVVGVRLFLRNYIGSVQHPSPGGTGSLVGHIFKLFTCIEITRTLCRRNRINGTFEWYNYRIYVKLYGAAPKVFVLVDISVIFIVSIYYYCYTFFFFLILRP